MLIYPVMDPTWRNMQWRFGEEEFLENFSEEIYTFEIDKADTIYTRPVAELVTDERRKYIQNFLAQHEDKKIVNHIDRFLDHDSKDRSFAIWRANGIQCPHHRICSNEKDLKDFIAKYGAALLKINNGAEGKHTYYVNEKHVNNATLKLNKLLLVVRGQKRERSDSKILLVEFIGSANGNHCQCRSFVVGNKVICSYALGMQTFAGRAFQKDFKQFVQQNVVLENLLEKPGTESEITRAVSLLGCDTGAVDYIIVDNQIFFLEVNAFWGMGRSTFPFVPSWVEEMQSSIETLRLKIPHACARFDIEWFWKEFYVSLAGL